MNASTDRLRPRFSRTFSRARWTEYREFLQGARAHAYRIVPLEAWLREPIKGEDPTLILRHDIDQHPRSALAMAKIETELGVSSTWYFRWRTAHPAVVRALRRAGFEVGLHYETLTRKALKLGITDLGENGSVVEESRADLRREISTFARLFGPIVSASPHGDSRVPMVHNADLLRGEDCADFGIEFDTNEAMRGRGLAHWLTDRTSAEGGWKNGIDPVELFAEQTSPILSVTHPNNWASGPSLWLDRMLKVVLPSPRWDSAQRPGRPIRTGSDVPPR